jgi:hypothetical protein
VRYQLGILSKRTIKRYARSRAWLMFPSKRFINSIFQIIILKNIKKGEKCDERKRRASEL